VPAGQRLAGPYSAPGQKAAIARRALKAEFGSVLSCCSLRSTGFSGGKWVAASGAGGFGQLGEALDHQRQGACRACGGR
jgi:hypothetical protein